MVRNYRRRRDPHSRMFRAARLRAEGKSLRQIAAEMQCSHDTVWRDLKKWDAQNAKVTQLSESTVRKSPPRGEILTAESDSTAPVIPLRRIS